LPGDVYVGGSPSGPGGSADTRPGIQHGKPSVGGTIFIQNLGTFNQSGGTLSFNAINQTGGNRELRHILPALVTMASRSHRIQILPQAYALSGGTASASSIMVGDQSVRGGNGVLTVSGSGALSPPHT